MMRRSVREQSTCSGQVPGSRSRFSFYIFASVLDKVGKFESISEEVKRLYSKPGIFKDLNSIFQSVGQIVVSGQNQMFIL